MQSTNSISEFYHLHLHTADHSTCTNLDIPPLILPWLSKSDHIFKEPINLPPQRQFDHYIHLEPGVGHVSVWPYRYPHFQKQTIENFISEMTKSGIIRRSTSAFSSPVLLV